jgi:hypothetical protein
VISRALIKKQPGRRWLTYGAGLGLLVITLGAAGSALAVHDLKFQLDGDTSSVAQNNPNDPDPAPPFDWDDIFTATGGNTSLVNPAGGNNSFTAASFKRDFLAKATRNGTCKDDYTTDVLFCTVDSTTFATGSKDILDIPDWQCNKDNNVNSKIDIMNAYAAQFQASDGDRIMYFGLDKNKDNGNNNVAFWFLKDRSVDCSSPGGGAVDFTGEHRDGDVLVVSAFTGGGGVSTIDAYRWDGTDGCIDNPDEPGACDDLPVASGGDCKAANLLDDICATTNSGTEEENDDITTKWKTADATLGVGTTVVPPDFFEGGINLSEVLGGATCFSTFVADTRSSQSLESTLFDFARGRLGGCETTLLTKAGLSSPPKTGEVAPPSSIGTGSVQSGTDTATLTITGTPVWGGTLSWYICGPIASPALCDQSQGVPITSRTVSNTSLPADFISGQATLTSAGRYCWSAHFEPDPATAAAGVDPDDDDGVGECFTVAAVTPTLSTQASCTSIPCVLGVDTISDTATLTGTASRPGSGGGGTPGVYTTINPTTVGAAANNSISWTLYGPNNSNCTTNSKLTTSRTVSGDGTYPKTAPPDNQAAVSYTPVLADGVGVYVFVASYPGDSPNTNAATTTGCSDTNERVTLIGSASITSAQRWLPNDRIVLSTTGGTLTGTLTVKLYSGTFTVTGGVCTPDGGGASAFITGQQYTFNPSGATSPAAFNTSNTTFFVGTKDDGTAGGSATNYFWLIHYDDNNLTDPPDRCEKTAITITD